jgi:hypothetical protein
MQMATKSKPEDGMTLDIGALKLDQENVRLHGDSNLEMIADSLVDAGAARSIVIDEDNNIVVGSGTTEAAMGVGFKTVRVIEADGTELVAVRRRGLTEEQKRMLKLRDNRAGELAIWNAEVLQGYADQGIDLGIVFNEMDLDAILAASGDALVLPDQGTEAFYKDNPMANHPFAGMKDNPDGSAPGSGIDADENTDATHGAVDLNALKGQYETGVRPVQIFLTVKQHERFMAAIKKVAVARALNNVTDVIYALVLEAAETAGSPDGGADGALEGVEDGAEAATA